MANQLHSGHVKQEATQKRRTDEALERGLVQGAMTPNVAQLQRAAEDPARAQAADILALQRTAGNRAVSRLIQAKLTVGAAGDRYEQEADRVADQVLAMGAPAGRQRSGDGGQPGVQRQGEEEEVQTKPLAATITPLIQRQMDEEEVQTKPDLQRQMDEEEVQTKPDLQRQMEEEEVQTKPDLQRRADGGFDTGPRVESRLSALKGGGSPLPAGVRSYMEPRFGADFSGVRLHTGSEAAQLNTSLRAQAFTHGQDIYLGSGASAPGSEAGNRLLAHELAHTIQQGSGTNRIARWGTPHGGTGHDVLTKEAFATLEPEIKRWYSDEAQEYLAGYSESIDIRAGFLAGSFLLGKMYQYLGYKPATAMAQATRVAGRGLKKGAKSMGRGLSRGVNVLTGGKLGMGKAYKELAELTDEIEEESQSETDKKRVAEAYNDIKWYWRNPGEAANHGEAGKYRADGSAEDEARVNGYIKSAVAAWKGKNKNQALATLGLALHSAQDRGSHGDGKPGTGHDPRRVTPPPNEYARQDCYDGTDGFACDRKGENPEGWDFGVGLTQEVLSNFAYGIGLSGSKELTDQDLEVGAKLKGYEQPNKLKRFIRKTGTFFGKDVIKTR